MKMENELTGKCKEDFENWFSIEYATEDVVENLYMRSFSMAYGVYVDFFDSVGVWISDLTSWHGSELESFGWFVTTKNKPLASTNVSTRQEARAEAIRKANEIYNNKYIGDENI